MSAQAPKLRMPVRYNGVRYDKYAAICVCAQVLAGCRQILPNLRASFSNDSKLFLQYFQPMQTENSFPAFYRQNNQLAIRLIAPSFGHLPASLARDYGLTQRKPYYFFLFMLQGQTEHGVDLQNFTVRKNQLLFILPHQIHRLPAGERGKKYFKLGFDEHCLSLLPTQYPFLINPYNNPQVQCTNAVAARLEAVFTLLQDLLSNMDTEASLVLAHLHVLLTEINIAYFSTEKLPANHALQQYMRFKDFVEAHFTEQLSIDALTQQLDVSSNRLYNLVSQYAGVAPKTFITNRIILEAKRRLYYAESSVKELAYDLGFNDPDYFARLFKKATGKTITSFVQDLSGK